MRYACTAFAMGELLTPTQLANCVNVSPRFFT